MCGHLKHPLALLLSPNNDLTSLLLLYSFKVFYCCLKSGFHSVGVTVGFIAFCFTSLPTELSDVLYSPESPAG